MKRQHGSGRRQKDKALSALKSKKSKKKNGRKLAKQQSRPSREADNINIDIEAQLQRQRQKQQTPTAAAKEKNVGAENLLEEGAKTSKSSESVGDFQYDPIQNRYFPKSTYSGNSNDVCIHHIQKKISSHQNTAPNRKHRPKVRNVLLENNQPFYINLGRVIFRGTCLPTTPPFQLPCTDKTTLLLRTSLEYCANPRRKAIASMLGPRSIARRAKVVPIQSTLEMIRNKRHMHNNTCIDLKECTSPAWPIQSHDGRLFSMLHPLKAPKQSQLQQGVPHDCICKSYLHPTAHTFDVLQHNGSTALPHIATISNDAIYYRTPYKSLQCNGFSESLQCHGVRFAPFSASDEESSVGCVTHDSNDDESVFALLKESGGAVYPLAAPVNDFCFAPDASSPGLVAFAHSGDSNRASFLDISTGSYFSIDNWTHSEPLCLQFRKNNNNQLLFGHRDGGISMIDTRTNGAVFATSSSTPDNSFGSATAIQPLQAADLVVVKGSFGSCRVFDLRQQSTLFELSIPDDMVHQTKSVRCTGLAVDPTESVAIAPFAGPNSCISFGIWDINSGELLRTLNLGSSNAGTGISAFCELSSVVTSGYEMLCKKDSDTPEIFSEGGSCGLWFKTNVMSASSPPEVGGIHHIRF